MASGLHTIGRWVSERARLHPDRVAVESGGQSLTYRQLDDAACVVADGLAGRGLATGDRVATVCENHLEQLVLLLACARSRLALAPLNWRLAPRELALQLAVLEPAALWCSADFADKAGEALRGLSAQRGPLRPEPIEELLSATRRSAEPLPEPTDDDPLLVIFTSGSTGRPKGAVLTQANCFWTNLSLDGTVPLRADDVVLQVLPQCHVGGWNVQPLQALFKGARLLIEPRFDAGRALDTIARNKVTTMMGVPTTYLMIAEHPDFAAADLSSLRTVIVGGAAMPVALIERYERRGVEIVQGYGLTEAAPNVLCLPPEDAVRHAGSAGKPYLFVDVRLRDPASRAVVAGAGSGEICVRGPNVFRGYLADDEATAAAFDEDGWLVTGDLAERDGDGYYTIRGRSVEMFVSGGENVYPGEIEAVLAEHDAVVECAVIGVPHPRWGETALAFVVVRRPTGDDELEAHCRERLAGYKVPREFRFVTALPKSSTGKVDRRELKAEAAANRGEGEER